MDELRCTGPQCDDMAHVPPCELAGTDDGRPLVVAAREGWTEVAPGVSWTVGTAAWHADGRWIKYGPMLKRSCLTKVGARFGAWRRRVRLAVTTKAACVLVVLFFITLAEFWLDFFAR